MYCSYDIAHLRRFYKLKLLLVQYHKNNACCLCLYMHNVPHLIEENNSLYMNPKYSTIMSP